MATRRAGGRRAPHTLHAEDHYIHRWSSPLRSHVWVLRHVRPVSWFATAFNLYVLTSAVKMIESFQYAQGVLQGCPLSSTLFVIGINPLASSVRNGSLDQ